MTEQTKRNALSITIALSLFPSALLLAPPTHGTLSSGFLWLSAVFGYIGVTLLLWMYILGAKSVMGLWFRDLAPVLSIHKWLGKYGTVLIFLHPVFVTISYGESWLYSFIPHTGTVTQRHILLGQIAFWLLVLVWVVSALARDKLSWRTWRYLHWLAYVTIPFALLHIPDLGSQEQTHLWVKGYFFVLALGFLATSGLRLRGLLNLDKSRYTVSQIIRLSELDSLVRLAPAEAQRITPRRGQYIYIKLGFISEDHPFSVVQYSEETGEITLGFRRSGMFTKELEKLTAGRSVYLGGPYGAFTEELATDDDTPVVYLAGGIGVTPFVDRIMSEHSAREQWLFAANRTRSLSVLYTPLKEQLGDRAVAVLGADEGSLGPNEERGYITADLLRKYLPEPQKYHYYLCGPPAMMDAMQSVVASLGIAPSQVHSEQFGW